MSNPITSRGNVLPDTVAPGDHPASPTVAPARRAHPERGRTRTRLHRNPFSTRQVGQRGVALVVALILLLVVTLVGIAAVRGTIMQQKMASNLYDRQIAFQNAESALRAAALRIPTNPTDVARNCQSTAVVCPSNPFDDTTLPSTAIHSVGTGQYTAGTLATGQPQYVVENMGNFVNSSSNTGYGQSANSKQYGAAATSPTSIYYRITARSGDPLTVGDRSVVVLQALIKQG